MNIDIKHRYTRAILFSVPADSLQRANLQGADLQGANLEHADLQRANLEHADLQHADLQHADLRGANLRHANLQDANLRDANLRGANLRGANLQGANLQGADLQGADLQRADLQGAVGADLAIAKTRILPDGDLIGWKKCDDYILVKLRIPATAKRSHAFGRKCRAEYADVLEIIDLRGAGRTAGVSSYNGRTEYFVGKRVVPDIFDEDWRNECSHGIHFFITRAEAEAYS